MGNKNKIAPAFLLLLALFLFQIGGGNIEAQTARNSLLTASAVQQELTQHYINYYSTAWGIAHLNTVMERANLYLPFINEEIKKRNLPPELCYLPVIESNFQITARSKSGAAGLWQFMLNSISPFNIKVNSAVDERLDFQKSTRSALQKLQDNYKALGNWEMALAAYNCGLGETKRTVQRTKSRNYWELSKKKAFRNETVQYVPKLIAVAYILSQPEKFGINYNRQTVEWTSIPLGRRVSLDLLADEAETDRELLGLLNAELLQGITPADKNFRLKVPADKFIQISAVLQRGDISLIDNLNHVVKKGDTFWSLSRKYSVTPQLMAKENNMDINQILSEGKILKVPIIE